MDNGNSSFNSVKIGELYDKYLARGYEIHSTPTGHELIYPKNLKVRTIGNTFKKVKCLSRHHTGKPLVQISFGKSEPLVVTTDHVCMAFNDDHMLENIASKDLRPGMVVVRYCRESDEEEYDSIAEVRELGPTGEYVYDLEVEDESHVFYANGTLVHNSFFMNLEAVTKDYISRNGWDDNLNNWTDDQKMELFRTMKGFTEDWLVPHIQDLIAREFHTTNAKVMKYGLEYVTSGGIFEAKKRYLVHKIVDGDTEKVIDKFKYTGISLKRTNTPPEIKEIMKDIYFSAVLDSKFGEKEMKAKIDEAYSAIQKMTPNELGIWMGYNTARDMSGFMVAEKGATGVSKAAGYYNQLIAKLGLGGKYAQINLKDKIQIVHLKPNCYGIDCIGFPARQWPEEFSDLFEIDYPTMVKKLLIQSMKGLIDAMGVKSVHDYDPSVAANLQFSVDDL